MQMTGNTILVTGGGSGIGQALAEALHERGNQVIIAGRRRDMLNTVTQANPGMASRTLDIANGDEIVNFAKTIIADYPALNIVINNAGIMRIEDITKAPSYISDTEAMITTNLLGPMRLSAALLPHLMAQKDASIVNMTSGLAFVPMAATPTYCATKAALHFLSVTMREQLKNTPVNVIEIAPPYVQTELTGPNQANDPNAMPLAEFTDEVMSLLSEGANDEIIVERCKPLRFAAENGKLDEMMAMMNSMEF